MSLFIKSSKSPFLAKGGSDLRRDKVPQIIALVFLFTFVASLIALFFINVYSYKILDKEGDIDFKKGWFDLLKNALVLLSTALTTVIGYYFGQREGSIKSEQAIQDSKNKDVEAAQLAQDIFDNRNKQEKESLSVGNDSPDESVSPVDPAGDIVLPK